MPKVRRSRRGTMVDRDELALLLLRAGLVALGFLMAMVVYS